MNPIITSDSQVRQYTPNVFTTVDGEVSLFEKLSPALLSAQMWLESIAPIQYVYGNTTSGSADGSPEESQSEEADAAPQVPSEDVVLQHTACRTLTERIVVLEAFRRAIPSLDLVLTPNGFGIVSNDNMAPASSDRVSRLIDQLEEDRDECIEQLITLILRTSLHLFYDYPQYSSWVSTIYRGLTFQQMAGVKKKRLSHWIQNRARVQFIEDDLAEKYISRPVLEQLRRNEYDFIGIEYEHLRDILSIVVLQIFQSNVTPVAKCREMADYARTTFPTLWEGTSTAALYTDAAYVNHKDSGAFWL